MTTCESGLKELAVGVCVFLTLTMNTSAQDFGVDPRSPEVPTRSPADIYDSPGANLLVSAAELGLQANENIDAMSYGHDQIVPLGPFNFVQVFYSVDRNTVGHRGDGFPGGGAVFAQSTNDGAAGDKFFIRAVGIPLFGMIPISRGVRSNAPMHNLTALPPVESDLDQLSGPSTNPTEPVYFSVDFATAFGRPNWDRGDILRVDPGQPTPAQPPEIWATAIRLGLQGRDIDALVIRNTGNMALDAGDVVWVSLEGDARVLQVFPGPQQEVFTAQNVNLLPGDELNALTGVDPGISGCGIPDASVAQKDAILGTLQALRKRIVPKHLAGSLPEIVAQLEQYAERKFRIANSEGLPAIDVKLASHGLTISDVLQTALQPLDWGFEVSLGGDVILYPSTIASPYK